VEVSTEDSTEVKLAPEKLNGLLEFCATERSRKEMQEFCGIKSDEYFRKNIITPMLTLGLIRMTVPDKPNSRNQKYVRAYHDESQLSGLPPVFGDEHQE
jgi:ATP-dependent DNA helicase RecG